MGLFVYRNGHRTISVSVNVSVNVFIIMCRTESQWLNIQYGIVTFDIVILYRLCTCVLIILADTITIEMTNLIIIIINTFIINVSPIQRRANSIRRWRL